MKRAHTLAIALTILVLTGGFSLTTSAFARPEGHGPDRLGRFEEYINRRLERLDLNESQRSTVQTLLHTHAKEVIRLRADMDTMRVDLRQLLHTEPVDLVRVKQALQAIAAKAVDLRLAHITVMQEIRQVLTPEQQKQFQTRPEQHRARDGGERH